MTTAERAQLIVDASQEWDSEEQAIETVVRELEEAVAAERAACAAATASLVVAAKATLWYIEDAIEQGQLEPPAMVEGKVSGPFALRLAIAKVNAVFR